MAHAYKTPSKARGWAVAAMSENVLVLGLAILALGLFGALILVFLISSRRAAPVVPVLVPPTSPPDRVTPPDLGPSVPVPDLEAAAGTLPRLLAADGAEQILQVERQRDHADA